MGSFLTSYLIVFSGLMIGGELALVPAIYFAVEGTLQLSVVLALVVIATLLSDTLWYVVGRWIDREWLFQLSFFARRRDTMDWLSLVLRDRVFSIVFMSKFIHGTRWPLQILCGMHQIPYRSYIVASLGGAFLWALFLVGVMYSIEISLDSVKDTAYYLQFSVGLFILFVIVGNYFIGRYVRKKFFGRKE